MMDDDESVEVQNKAPDVEVPDEAAAGETAKGDVSVGVGKYKVHVSDVQLPLVGIFFAGMVLLIAVCVGARGAKYYAYAISVASVAMVFSFLGGGLTFKEDLHIKVGKYNDYFLLIWNFVGACFITFSSPFTVTGNGYFAAWGLVIFSLMAIDLSVAGMTSAVAGMGSLLGLGASSIIVIIATATELGENTFWRTETIYALVVACMTVPVVGAFAAGKAAAAKFWVLAVFAILWIVLACLVTFSGPFLVTGNGYFGSWGGAVTSVFATMSALKD